MVNRLCLVMIVLIFAAAAPQHAPVPATQSAEASVPTLLRPTSFVVARGTAAGGDETMTIVSHPLVRDGRFHSVEARADFTLPSETTRPGAPALRITLRLRADEPTLLACDVQTMDHTADAYVSVDKFAVEGKGRDHTVIIEQAGRFFSADGTVNLRLRLVRRGTFTVEVDPPQVEFLSAAAARAASGNQWNRLMHFQAIGFSHPDRLGRVSPRVCTPQDGWRPHLQMLQGLIARLGPGSFDWYGHRTGGGWPDVEVWLTDKTQTYQLFEQMEIARERFPALMRMDDLAAFCRQHEMKMHGYIGFPRCHTREDFRFEPVPAHGDPEHFDRWYREFVRYGFVSVGHDWTTHLPADSPTLEHIFPMLRERGIDPMIEAVPFRKDKHLLGYSVVSEERRWQFTERNPDTFWTEKEINDAGGRTIHILTHPPDRIRGKVDVQQWRWDNARRLLREGKTVAVALNQLAERGYPIEELVTLARHPARARSTR